MIGSLSSGLTAKARPDRIQFRSYPLEHAYTPAALGFEALKGADAGAAGVLAAAAKDADVDLHLALLTIEESGWAEHVLSSSYYDRWHLSDDAFEAGEVTDGFAALSDWRRLDGTSAALGDIPVDDDELSPPGSFDQMEPDEEHFQEATGNEGASFERTYRRAALVLWPQEQFFAVLCQAGLKATLPCLDEMVENWTANGKDPGASLRLEAQDLAKHMLSSWTMERWYPGDGQGPSNAAKMLMLLAKLEDTTPINAFLTSITAGGDYPKLAPIANRWMAAMGMGHRYPETLDAFLAQCHKAGQRRPTPLLLKYQAGDYNCLHQDLYGEQFFPTQLVILLSEPETAFEGGEFVLTEQRPRMQSRAEVVPLARGEGVLFAVSERPKQGTRGTYRVKMRHGVSRVRRGHRYTTGIIFHDAA